MSSTAKKERDTTPHISKKRCKLITFKKGSTGMKNEVFCSNMAPQFFQLRRVYDFYPNTPPMINNAMHNSSETLKVHNIIRNPLSSLY